MTDDTPNEVYEEMPQRTREVAFLITASELRNRKTKRRWKHDPPGLTEIGLKAKGK
jgi:hypothetical protein